MLSACKHYPQRDRTDKKVEPKYHYVPKSNMETREENMNLHVELINFAYTTASNDLKSSSLGGVAIDPKMALIRRIV